MNTLNTKTHSSKEKAEFSFENADVKSICYCKQRVKSILSLSSECVETKLCKPCTSFTSYLHSWCGMVRYRTPRVKRLPFSVTNILAAGYMLTRKLTFQVIHIDRYS